MAKKIVIVVDMQRDFMDYEDSALPIAGSSAIVDPINNYLATLNPNEVEAVLVTQDWHTADHIEYNPDGNPFPSHCVIDTPGAEVIVNINAINSDIPVFGLHKNEFNMWEESDIKIFPISHPEHPEVYRNDWFFRYLRENISEIEVIGVAADVCVQAAIAGAVEHGFNVKVIEELTKGLFREMDQVINEDFSGKKVELVKNDKEIVTDEYSEYGYDMDIEDDWEYYQER